MRHAIILCFSLLLFACGKTGDLYLPAEDAAASDSDTPGGAEHKQVE